MRDEEKTREQLIAELSRVRSKLRRLESGEEAAALSRRNRELEALNRVSEASRQPGDQGVTFRVILEEIRKASEFSIAALEAYDLETGTMQILSEIGLGLDLTGKPLRIPLNESLSGVVARTGQKIIEFEASRRSEYSNETLRKLGVETFLCLPIFLAGNVWGTISLADSKRLKIDDSLIQVLESLANQIGLMLERREAEIILRENHALLLEAATIANLGHYVLDIPHDSWKSSELLDRIFGIDQAYPRTITGWVQLIHPAHREEMAAYFQNEVLGKRLPFNKEYRVINQKDKTDRWVHGLGRLELDEKGRPIRMVGTIQDITDRRKREEALAATEQKFRTLFENASEGILVADLATRRFLFANRAICKMFGYSESELLSKGVGDIHPARAVPGVIEEFEAQARGEKELALDIPCLRKDGSIFYADISTAAVKFGEQLCNVGFFTDVTQRLKLQEQKIDMERRLLHSQKLESLGILAGGIAHDFNNILMAVIGHSNLARRRIDPTSRGMENLHQIELAAGKAADLSRQLLAYSGKGKFVVEPLDLTRIAEEMNHLLSVSISKKAGLRYDLAKDLPSVQADATQIRQIIMNLVINASDAIGENPGIISLKTGSMDCDATYLEGTWSADRLEPGSYVFLEVCDSGCGMDKETLTRIFDPFFTTKVTGRGLGLAAVLGIVRGHHGCIKVYSEPGRGSMFKVLFPASTKKPSEVPAGAANEEWQGRGKILLVDDEEAVRQIGKALLQELGFEVETAMDGRDAVTRFMTRTSDFSCVVLDLTMPTLDGVETFRALRQISPDLPVIISSGYNEQEVAPKFLGKGLAGFIQKPYNLPALRKVLQRILENPTRTEPQSKKERVPGSPPSETLPGRPPRGGVTSKAGRGRRK